MIRSFFSGLRVRLVVLVLVAVLPAFGLIVWTGIDQRREERASAEKDALRIAQLTASQEGQSVESARQLLAGLTHVPQVTNSDPAACHTFLADLMTGNEQYTGIGVVAVDGTVVCSSLPLTSPINVGLPYFQQVLRTREFAVGGYLSPSETLSGKPLIPFGYPVLSEDGEVQAVLAAGLSLAWFNDAPDLPIGAVLTVIDRNGVILAGYPEPEDWVGKALPAGSLREAILAGGPGTAQASGVDGVERLYAFVPLTGTPEPSAFVAVGFSTSAVFAAANGTLTRNLAGLGVVALLALAAALFGGQAFLLRRVRALAAAAERLRAGQLNARSGLPHDQGELGQLARGFDAMARAIEQREADHRRDEEALRESEERTRKIIEAAYEAFISIDGDGVITEWNARAEAIFGWNRSEARGKLLADTIIPQEDREAHLRGLKRFLETGDGPILHKRMELTALHRDGHLIPVGLAIWPVRSGSTWSFSAVVEDISERKRVEEQLARRAEELAHSNAELESFTYSISHDLKEPLRTLEAFSQFLLEDYADKLDHQGRDYLVRISNGSARLKQMIEELLTLSRLGQRPEETNRVSVSRVVANVAASLQATVEGRGAAIEVEDGLPDILGDRTRVEQIFGNLITNGLKFNKSTEPTVHIGLWEMADDMAVFYVRDNGIGIEPQYHQQMFGVFQRLHRREEYGGSGAGLAIVKRATEALGGQVWLESEPGAGATFFVSLPLWAKAEARVLQEVA